MSRFIISTTVPVVAWCLLVMLALVSAAPTSNPIYHGYGPENVTQYSGYITVNSTTNGNIFYWLFESRNQPKTDPFILWMTGGPGCSSMMALFEENGPYKIQQNLSLSLNPYSWNNNATIVYVDQPVGTGLSTVNGFQDYVKTSQQVGQDMWIFMQTLLQTFPQYSKLPFFVFGESYGGHYAPAVSAQILDSNANLGPGEVPVNLKGMGLGDGWVDPMTQYKSFPVYGYENGLIGLEAYAALNKTADACIALIAAKKYNLAWLECQTVMMGVAFDGELVNQTGIVNWYDIRLKCPVDLLLAGCYNFSLITDLINQPQVRTALGIPQSLVYSSCDTKYLIRMRVDDLASFRPDIVKLLDSGIRVVSYNGMQDLICNNIGESWLYNAMDWSGKIAFKRAATTPWHSNNQVAGTVKTAGTLTYVTVNGAGHMVPMDQPAVALTIVNNIIFDIPFS